MRPILTSTGFAVGVLGVCLVGSSALGLFDRDPGKPMTSLELSRAPKNVLSRNRTELIAFDPYISIVRTNENRNKSLLTWRIVFSVVGGGLFVGGLASSKPKPG